MLAVPMQTKFQPARVAETFLAGSRVTLLVA